MSRKAFTVGDRVIVAPDFARAAHRGVVYQVTRTLPVNVIVEPVAGGRPMRINPTYLLPAPDDDATPATAPAGSVAVGVPYVPQPQPLEQGTVVTVAGPGWAQPPEQLYVVLRHRRRPGLHRQARRRQRPLLARRAPHPDHRHRPGPHHARPRRRARRLIRSAPLRPAAPPRTT